MLPLAQQRKKTCRLCNTEFSTEAALRVFVREERVKEGEAAPLGSFPIEGNSFQRVLMLLQKAAVLLLLLLWVGSVQEVLQRCRKSACGSSFLLTSTRAM